MNPRGDTPEKIRKPAVAGAFYPDNPKDLRKQVDGFLSRAEGSLVDGDIMALVSPHAGYVYSGQIAATAYKQVQGNTYDAVVVIAPSHTEYFSGVSVYDRGAYETPLGLLRVEEHIARAIVESDPIIRSSEAGHRGEHALEVQLPFLQCALTDPKIVPIVMADRTCETCKRLAGALAGAIQGKKVLIVASSDLYHGNSYDECVAADSRTLEAIQSYDTEELCDGFNNDTYQACGGGPITVALLVAQQMGATTAGVIARTNSNEVTGEKGGYCVGYAAVAVYAPSGEALPREKMNVGIESGLNEEEKTYLLQIARTTIEKKVKGEDVPEFSATSKILGENRGAFVTIHKHGQLRGCIGYIEAVQPLYLTIREMAEAAALSDPRFPPVNADELDDLDIEISALTPLRKMKAVEEIKVGLHGIYIRKGYASGLLLPQVATEYGWDRDTFLQHTCMKAGLPTDAWQEKDTEIFIFSADIFSETEKQGNE